MKKTALLAAVAIASVAVPAAAEGYLGLQYSNGDAELFTSADYDTWRVDGAYGFALGQNWRAQVEGEYSTLETDTGGSVDSWALGGHVWWQADNWRLGVGAAAVQLDDAGFTIDERTYGIEGAYDIGESFRVRGSYAFGTVETSPSNELDSENVDLALSYYATPNMRFDAMLGSGSIDDALDTTSYGIGGEIMPWSTPVSLTFGWKHFELDTITGESDTLQLGVRWNFGSESLRDRDNATPFHLDTGFNDRLFGFF